MSKKEKNFKDINSLSTVVLVLNEVDTALKNPTRTILDSEIPEIIGGLSGIGIGGAAAFAAVVTAAGGKVAGGAVLLKGLAALGGGIWAGLALLLAGVGVVGVGASLLIKKLLKNKRFKKEIERLYQLALQKNDALIRAMQKEIDATKERADYLNDLNKSLKNIIRAMQEDFGYPPSIAL